MILAALMMSVVGLDADADYVLPPYPRDDTCIEAVEFYWKDARAQWTIDCP